MASRRYEPPPSPSNLETAIFHECSHSIVGVAIRGGKLKHISTRLVLTALRNQALDELWSPQQATRNLFDWTRTVNIQAQLPQFIVHVRDGPFE